MRDTPCTHKSLVHKPQHWVGWSGLFSRTSQSMAGWSGPWAWNSLSISGWSGPGTFWTYFLVKIKGFCEWDQMIRTYARWSGPGNFFECVLTYSVTHPDDPRLHRMIPNSQKTHIMVTCGGGAISTPSAPPLSLSSSLPTKPAPKAFIPPLSSIQKLDSWNDSLRDWEEVRFGSWFVSISWDFTCSSQEALEATSIPRFTFFTLGALLLDG